MGMVAAREVDSGMRARAQATDPTHICYPDSKCRDYLWAHARKAGVSPSDEPHDFFFLSEFRAALLHTLGYINWVWY